MSHARIEEVSDSDLDSDPSEGDISDVESELDSKEILRRREPAPKGPKPSQVQPPRANPNLIDPQNIQTSSDGTQFQTTQDEAKYKNFACIYPVYFDINRSRKEGRMVGKELAVENPLAREIVAACGRLRLEALFEPAKMHPKDWANPGRVKIKLKGGIILPSKIVKHHLYTLISAHLKSNPTTPESAQRVRIPGVPTPDPSKPYPEPAIPKGWKMGTILPYYSSAITGGGVSENFFKDMMAEMQGAGGMPGGGMPGGGGMPDMAAMQAMMGGMGGMGGAGPSGSGGAGGGNKKEKKKIKR
ncbi:signal recognition particle, SRP19 subunit [Halenospora varia]|nr:signal recognition particle, SRP19 subunit [Halenospora varia]